MIDIDFGKYPTYDELEETLVKLTTEYPSLTRLFSIGQSLQGRELWTVEITNKATGPAEEKPGLWIDGNTHSSEPAGTNVCLKTIWYLCSQYNHDEFVTELLNNRIVYVLPRVNPDGAEVFLTKPYHYTAGGIPNPEFWDGEGHYEEVVDRTRRQVEWVVKTDAEGLEVTVVARCPRAGTNRVSVTLQ